VSANWNFDPGTKVGQLIQNLSKATKESEVNALAEFTQSELQRLTDLRDTLKSDPLQKAKETRAAVGRADQTAIRVLLDPDLLGSEIDVKSPSRQFRGMRSVLG
jgi:hypothetical protein